MHKRSLTIAGHHTSIALEPEFWDGLEAMASRRGLRLVHLIEEIDRTGKPVSCFQFAPLSNVT